MFGAYKKFIAEEGMPSMGRNDFAKELKKQVPSILEGRDKARKWKGITTTTWQNSTLSTV
jgi:hypothetical protein